MSAKPLALEGFIEEPRPDEGAMGEWRREKQHLENENRSLRREVEDLTADKERMARTIKNMQRLLGPIHQGMRALFGEIELAVGEETPIATASNGGSIQQSSDPRWESYKKRFSGKCAEIIDALLIHEEMGLVALSSFVGSHRQTVSPLLTKLKQAGALDNSGGKWRLKR